MKIIVLNVNNFGGMEEEKPRWFQGKWKSRNEYRTAVEKFQMNPKRVEMAKKIVEELIDRAENAADIFVFSEFDINSCAGKEAVELFKAREYLPVYPDKKEAEKIKGNLSITLMFVKDSLQRTSCFNPVEKDLRWCVIEADDIIVAGIKISGNEEDRTKLKRYAVKYRDKKMLILGDYNIATDKNAMKRWEEQLKSKKKTKEDYEDFMERRKWLLEVMPKYGYVDMIEEKPATYFKGETTIDHVLVSPLLRQTKRNIRVRVYDEEELSLSDHAVILVDIDE